MIVEELMAPGRWDIALNEFTPDSIRDGIEARGHLFVLPEWIDPASLDDTTIKAFSRYTGRCFVINPGESGESGMSLSGYGLDSWLGINGRGPTITTTLVFNNTPWQTFVSNLLNVSANPHLQTGTVTGTPSPVNGQFFGQTIRTALQYAAQVSGAEWRVNPDGTIDSGTQAELFVTTPTALMVRNPIGFDPSIDGFGSSSLESRIDSEEWVSAVHILGKGDFYNGSDDYIMGSANLGDIGKTNPYKDLFGNDDDTSIIVNDPVTFVAQAAPRAQVLLGAAYDLSQKVTLSAENFDISGQIAVGDVVWVYSPPKLVDNSNWVKYGDGWVHPVAIRVFGIQWPVTEGMGVYYRNHDGTYLDLSPYVVWESGATAFTVGDRNRSPFDLDDNLTGVTLGMVNQPSNATDTPDVPAHANLPWTTSSYTNADGVTFAQVQVEWTTPLNTDGSPVTDGSHYTIRYRIQGESEYSYVSVEWGTNVYLLQNLLVGQPYEISVAAYDLALRSAGYAADTVVVTAGDGVPPSKPAVPTVAGNPLEIFVKHELGKDTGGTYNLELDTRRLDVHVSETSGFTPDATTLVGAIPVTVGNITSGIAVVGAFSVFDSNNKFVRVVAVDAAGNESTPSEQATVTASLIGDAYITDLTVDKLLGGTISTTTISVASLLEIATGGNIRSANYVAGVSGFDIDGTTGNAELNDATVRGTVEATSGDLANLTVSGTLDITTGGKIAVTTGVIELDNLGSIRTTPVGSGFSMLSIFSDSVATMRWSPSAVNTVSDATLQIGDNTGNPEWVFAGPNILNGPLGYIKFTPAGFTSSYTSTGETVNYALELQLLQGSAVPNAAIALRALNGTDVVLEGSGSQGVVVKGSKGLLIDTAGTGSDPALNINDDAYFYYGSGQVKIRNDPSGTEVVLGGSGFAPATDGILDLGASILRWQDVWATNGTIQTSDPAMKAFTESPALSLDFVSRLRPAAWVWRNGGHRVHHGLDSDSVLAALDDMGLDTERFAGYVDAAVSGLRYSEFIGPLVAAVQELAERVEALES